MKGNCRGQQGAILVLTAFLLPFIIAFTGMAVDFGSAYVRRSQMQNAADAAALAGHITLMTTRLTMLSLSI